jgi:hypothetical protein
MKRERGQDIHTVEELAISDILLLSAAVVG